MLILIAIVIISGVALKVVLERFLSTQHNTPPGEIDVPLTEQDESLLFKLVVPRSIREVTIRRGSCVQLTITVVSLVSNRTIKVRLIAYREEIFPHALFLIRIAERIKKAGKELPESLAKALKELLPKGIEVKFSKEEVLVPPKDEVKVTVTIYATQDAKRGTYKIYVEGIAKADLGYAGQPIPIKVIVE